MDDADLLKVSGLSATSIAIILILYRIIKMAMGKKLVSSCCGRKLEVGVAVAEMTPKAEDTTIEICNPIQKKTPPPVEHDVRQSDGQRPSEARGVS